MGWYTWYRVARDAQFDAERARNRNERLQRQANKYNADVSQALDFLQDMDKAVNILKQVATLTAENYLENFTLTVQAIGIVENSRPVAGYSFLKTNFKNAVKSLQSALKYSKTRDMEEATIYAKEFEIKIEQIFSKHGALFEIMAKYNLLPKSDETSLSNTDQQNNAQNSISAYKTQEGKAFLLCLVLGLIGVHRFYLKKWFTGFIYFFTFGLFGVGWIVDMFTLAFKVRKIQLGKA